MDFKRINPVKLPLILFILAILISIVFSADKIYSLGEIDRYLTGILLFFMIITLSSREKLRVVNTIVLCAAIISILAIYQYFSGCRYMLNYASKENLAKFFINNYSGQVRAFATFMNPNTLAGYIIMIMPLALTLKRKLEWPLLLLLSIALLLTKSLGAFLSLFLGILLYLLLRKGFSIKRAFIIIAAGILGIWIIAARQNMTIEHLPAFSLTRRLDYWWDTLKIIAAHPLTGVGIGNFNLPLTRYAHNSYLQIWAEMGILGPISFLWLTAAILRPCFKKILLSPNKILIIPFLSSTIFLIHNMIDFTFFLPEVSLIWWIILGIAYL